MALVTSKCGQFSGERAAHQHGDELGGLAVLVGGGRVDREVPHHHLRHSTNNEAIRGDYGRHVGR